jgi:hypothetical protein
MTKRLWIFLIFATLLAPVQVMGQAVCPSASPVYIASPGPGGQVLKVDGCTGNISVVRSSLSEGVEGIAFNSLLYLSVPIPGSFVQMSLNTTSRPFDPTILSLLCSPPPAPCPVPPYSAVAFNPASGHLFFAATDGIYDFYTLARTATHVTSSPLGEGIAFTPYDLNHNLSFSGQEYLFVADRDNNTLLFSSPPYTSIAQLTAQVGLGQDSPLDQPVGVAVDSLGEVFVANHGTSQPGVVCFNFNGQVTHVGNYGTFPAGDLALYLTPNPYFGTPPGSFFVTTVQDDQGNGGKLWRLDPTNAPGDVPCASTPTVTLVADIGAAFAGNTVAGLLSGRVAGLTTPVIPTSPVRLAQDQLVTTLNSPTVGFGVNLPSGIQGVPGNLGVITTAIAYSPTDFANLRLAGSTFLAQYPNTACVAYPPNPTLPPNPCYVFQNQFLDLDTLSPTILPSTPGATVFATVNNLFPPNPINPGLLGAATGTNSWSNDFLTAFITPATTDPLTIVGTTSDLNQDFVAVSLGATVPGIFQGFQTPLAPKNARTFTAGETIRVSFQVLNAAGQFVTNATASLSVAFLGASPVLQAVSPANLKGISPDTFIYSTKANAYQFFLDTTGYAPGLYSLTVYSNSFPIQEVTFTIQ